MKPCLLYTSLTENEFLTVQTGRLDAADMEEVFLQEKPEMVLDATHPYAAEVTVNIRTACENTQTAYSVSYTHLFF